MYVVNKHNIHRYAILGKIYVALRLRNPVKRFNTYYNQYYNIHDISTKSKFNHKLKIILKK